MSISPNVRVRKTRIIMKIPGRRAGLRCSSVCCSSPSRRWDFWVHVAIAAVTAAFES